MPYDISGSAEDVLVTSKEEEQIPKLNVTDEETPAEFNKQVKAWILLNLGPSTVHYSLSSGVSTTNFAILSGAWFMLDVPNKIIYLICASGNNANVHIVGVR